MAHPSFRTLLTGLLITMVAVDVGALASLAYRAGHEAIDQTTLLLTAEIENDIGEELALLIDRPTRMIRVIERRVVRGELSLADRARLQHALADTLLATPTVSFFGYVDADGEGIWAEQVEDRHDLRRVWWNGEGWRQEEWSLSATGEVGAPGPERAASDPRELPWMKDALASDGPVWGELRQHEREDSAALDVAYAIRDRDGALLGVAQSGFLLAHLEDDLQRLATEHDAIVFLSDAAGKLLVTHEGRLSDHPVVAAVGGAALPSGGQARVAVEGIDYDVFSRALRADLPQDLSLDVAVPRDRFTGPLRRHFEAMALVTLAALLTAIALAWLTGRQMSRPLIDVARKARRIPEGDLSVELEGSRLREVNDLIVALREMIRGLTERDRMKDAFSRFVSPRLMEQVLADPEAVKPGGRTAEAVVMFSDLRGYTALSERLGAQGIVGVLNRYLERMISVIDAHGGWVTDVLGDGLLLVFGLDEDAEKAPRQAVRCAIAMQEALERFAAEIAPEVGVRLEMGIGAHLGTVVVGNIGNATKAKYGVIGDAVNTAARVESLTVGGEILVSGSLYEALADELEVETPREVPVKGKSLPLRVYGVRALKGPDGLRLGSADPSGWVPVSVEGEVWRVLGKQIGHERQPAQIIAVEARYLRVRTSAALDEHDDLRIDVGERSLYGRVRGVEADGTLLVRWTGGAADPLTMFAEAAAAPPR